MHALQIYNNKPFLLCDICNFFHQVDVRDNFFELSYSDGVTKLGIHVMSLVSQCGWKMSHLTHLLLIKQICLLLNKIILFLSQKKKKNQHIVWLSQLLIFVRVLFSLAHRPKDPGPNSCILVDWAWFIAAKWGLITNQVMRKSHKSPQGKNAIPPKQ